jgi:hypothetical protein
LYGVDSMSEQKKSSQVDAAVAAAAHHPGVAQHVGMPDKQNRVPGQGQEYQQDEDDVPVYSRRQYERAIANAQSGVPQAGGLQTASFEALQREIKRRQAEAMAKLKNIPTEWLELELQRRKETNGG